MEKSVTDQCPNLNEKQVNQTGRPATSCSEGMFTPVLGCRRLSRRDNAKALAALHARMLLHLLNQAALTLFCIRTGAVSALALARHLKNDPQSLQSIRQAFTPRQFRVCGLLRPPCLFQCHTWASSSSAPRGAVSAEG